MPFINGKLTIHIIGFQYWLLSPKIQFCLLKTKWESTSYPEIKSCNSIVPKQVNKMCSNIATALHQAHQHKLSSCLQLAIILGVARIQDNILKFNSQNFITLQSTNIYLKILIIFSGPKGTICRGLNQLSNDSRGSVFLRIFG